MAWKAKREGKPKPYMVRWVDPNIRRERSRAYRTAAARDVAFRQIEAAEARGESWDDRPELAPETISTMFAAWQAERRAEHFAPTTLATERHRYKSMVAPAFGDDLPNTVTASRVRTWRTKLYERGLTDEYVRKGIGILRTLLDRAVENGAVETNAVREITKRRSRPRAAAAVPDERHPLTWAEVEAIAYEMTPMNAALVRFARATGLRISEVYGVRRSRVDLEAGTLTVDCQIERETLALRPYLKADASHASLPLSDTAVAILRRHLDRYPAVGDGLIFRQRNGKPVRYGSWMRWTWRRAVAAADLPDPQPTPHDLRRGFGSELARRGVPVQHAQRLMRHTDPRITMRLYSHLDIEDLRDALVDAAI